MLLVSSFRDIIVVERKNHAKDEYGAIDDTWSTHLTLKAGVKYGTGGFSTNNYEVFHSNAKVFETHYRDIVAEDRIKFNNEYYKIVNIVEIGYLEGLQIYAEKINY